MLSCSKVFKQYLFCSPLALTEGESDLTQTGELMRFTISANMAGIPALSIPVGQSPSGARCTDKLLWK